MFGESDSESPRVPSPWDPFLASPSSPSDSSSSASTPETIPVVAPRGIPKLVPEAEQGNVEYKLKLISPSPTRFARLVTQLKWRLLEGGGQSYYELGVTDNGLLIGLSRLHLEQSLETLEMMAGEIGASVIVVKEIEVPKEMAEMNEKLAARYIDFETGEVKRPKHNLTAGTDSGDTSTTGTSTESDSDPPSTAAVFSMDPEVSIRSTSSTTLDLEISSVYKPRPMLARVTFPAGNDFSKQKGHHSGKKKPKALPQPLHSISYNSSPSLASYDIETKVPNKQQAKAVWRRQARDKRREEKVRIVNAPTAADTFSVIPALDGLHVSLDSALSTIVGPPLSPCERGEDPPVTNRIQEPSTEEGPRLIVEALVVRKLSLEEAFLDFGGFGFEV